MFFSGIGVGVQLRKQVAVLLKQGCGNGPELNVRIQALKDAIARQVRIANHLPVFGGVSGHPMLQLDHQPRVLG
jgi:hypothetical protein